MERKKSMITFKNIATIAVVVFALSSCEDPKEEEVTSKYENTSWKITYVDQTDHVVASDSLETMTYTDSTFVLNSDKDSVLKESLGTQFDFLADGKGVITDGSNSGSFTWTDAGGQLTFTFPELLKDSAFNSTFNVLQELSFTSPSLTVINWKLHLKGNSMMNYNNFSYRVKREDYITYKLEKK